MNIVLNLLDTLESRGIKLDLNNDENLVISGDKSALDQTLIAVIRDAKPKIVDYLKKNKKKQAESVISVVNRKNTPLFSSFAQQQLWLLDQIDGGSAHYNMPGTLRLSGALNHDALNRAYASVIERHESLRTYFRIGDDGQPLQVVQPAQHFLVPVTDLSGLKGDDQQLQITRLITEEARREFDLSRDLMIRVGLLKLAEDEYILSVTMHHIASDGWSMAILINEVCALYRAYTQGKQNPLPPLAIQYIDYAHWQRNWLQGEVLNEQLEYWATQLKNLPAVHGLPLDHPRPAVRTFVGNTYCTHLDTTVQRALNALCQATGATLFMGLHAAFSVLLARHSNETDIVVGSPIANREQAEVAGLIGFFANTLVLRSDLSGNPGFNALLEQSKRMLLEAYEHQQVPFEKIVEHLHPERSMSHSPLFQIMLVLQNNKQGGVLRLPDLTLSPVAESFGVAKYDLTLSVTENEQGLHLNWEYNTDLFAAATIARLANHFEILLKALLQNPQECVFKVEMLSPAERQQLLVEWNDTAADYQREQCIHELFEEQVALNPDAVAVIFEAQQLTYAQLNAQANQLAHYLIKNKQVKPDTLVGVCIERSVEMVIAILGILKAGAAYVPLDPDYPAARFSYILQDANLGIVLTQHHLCLNTPISEAQALCLDTVALRTELSIQPTSNISTKSLGLQSHHLAYVIYTSGSTGNPKGTLLTHTGLCNLTMAQGKIIGLSAASRILQFASIAFDASTSELCMALPQGGTIVLLNNESAKSPDAISAIVDQHRITHVTLPPVLLSLLDASQWQSVKTLIVAGEACSEQMAATWSRGRQFVNAYGPSETTVCATMGVYQPGQARLHIGKPLQNMTAYVVNSHSQLAPIGIAGELYIGGVGLARGYMNRPELTAEKFIANPFYDKNDPASSERLYKTGDLVRWRPDGNLEFLGRIDYQVKIRGFRIELGEIEQVMAAHPQVKDAHVLATQTPTGDKCLVAYVVASGVAIAESDDSEAATLLRHTLIQNLRQHLGQSLPDYMMPASFVLLDKMPLTPNGKVNLKALPELGLSQLRANACLAPSTETERILCEIWKDLLGVERVCITDNFFHLGGHSLLAMKLLTVLESRFNLELTVKRIFQFPNLEDLAAYLDVITPAASSQLLTNDVQDPEQEMETFQL